jgi:carbamoyltransferase
MVILGLNAYHGDAAAALVVDGNLVAAVEEERLNRVKHSAGFPSLAARWCLEDAGLDIREIDHVAVSRNPRANFAAKAWRVMRAPSARTFTRSRIAVASQIRRVDKELSRALGASESDLRAKVHFVEHHQAHTASAFFVSPFHEAAVLSADGFGDFVSIMLAHGKGNQLKILERVKYPHSLGIFYTAVTQWLGFTNYGDEGKVMGLAPYGTPRYIDDIRRLIKSDGGLFELDLDYFTHHRVGVDMTWDSGSPTLALVYSGELERILGAARAPGAPIEARHEDVAASLQAVLEESYLKVVNSLWERTRVPNLCLAGGVALNAVANSLIRRNTSFEELYIQPAAGDSGTAVGCAYHVWNQRYKQPRTFVMQHAYTGPVFGEQRITEAIASAGLASERYDDDVLFQRIAEYIASGKVIGWFQGRTEFGPRALGNRSILVDPRRPDMKDILNARIKHRETFRPFAPSVLADATGDWYEDDYPSPFMILISKTRAERRAAIPAVNHVDDTGRLQTVTPDTNPRYFHLIQAFERLSGTPILLNTSFNENEPIVCSPQDAIACFQNTLMDVLVLGNHVILRGAES